MISDYLNEETIRLKLWASGMEDAVAQAAEPLIRLGKIREGYVGRMTAAVRELGPYMVILPGIALAHAKSGGEVLGECMSLATFREPVAFGHPENDPVHTVIVIGSPEEQGHLTSLRGVSRLLGNKGFLQALREAEEPKEITCFFEKEE